jgi:hypothetical protein
VPILILITAGGLLAWFFYGQKASADVTQVDKLNTGGGTFTETDSDGNSITYPNTLGFRNHNPGNIRYITSNPFEGQIGQNQGYGVYVDMPHGVRAMGKQLGNYVAAGVNTISAIVTKYAPPASNPTAQYITNVSQATGIPSDTVLSWPDDQADLVAAMITQEQGSNPIPPSDLLSWLASA